MSYQKNFILLLTALKHKCFLWDGKVFKMNFQKFFFYL
jgi:hypothetical protein